MCKLLSFLVLGVIHEVKVGVSLVFLYLILDKIHVLGSSKPEYNYQLPGWSPVEQYLTLKLDNFTSWMTTRAPEELPGVEVLPLANYSDNLAISNRFYKLDLTFT